MKQGKTNAAIGQEYNSDPVYKSPERTIQIAVYGGTAACSIPLTGLKPGNIYTLVIEGNGYSTYVTGANSRYTGITGGELKKYYKGQFTMNVVFKALSENVTVSFIFHNGTNGQTARYFYAIY